METDSGAQVAGNDESLVRVLDTRNDALIRGGDMPEINWYPGHMAKAKSFWAGN